MAKRKVKNFDYGKDLYYFTIKNGYNSVITIKRKTKEEAIYAYNSYIRVNKECDWLGQWDGKQFIEQKVEGLAIPS